MELPKSFWVDYIAKLRKVNDMAAEKIRGFIAKYKIPQTKEEMDLFIDFAYGVASMFGDAAAELAAEMYDEMARISKVVVPPAIPAPTPDISEVAKAIVGTSKTGNEEIISGSISRLVKQTGVDTTMQNAIRDGAEWAWIPSGDTCAFCITLASRGWQRASKKAIRNGHAEHIHANCDCTYAVRFTPQMQVGGYDPERYREIYDEAEGRSSTAKINDIRRELYAENREKINAQKRSAYEKMRERESSAAEEMNV